MDEQAELLQQVLEDPDDDAPRLIFADWLEERGDPLAEFIRVQCILAPMPTDDPRRPALKEREIALLAQHGRQWLGPLRRIGSGHEFRRGFVEVITLEAPAFLRNADLLFHTIPLRHVRLMGAAEVIADLAECRFVNRLDGLQLNANYLADHGVQALVSSPNISQLSTLHLGHNRIGDDGISSLAASPHVAQLTTLELAHNNIRNRGARALAESPHLARLTMLNLANNRIRDAGASALAGSPHLTQLKRLDLSGHLGSFSDDSTRGNEITGEQRFALKQRFGELGCHF